MTIFKIAKECFKMLKNASQKPKACIEADKHDDEY